MSSTVVSALRIGLFAALFSQSATAQFRTERTGPTGPIDPSPIPTGWTCAGNCGTDGADGVVSVSPTGNAAYEWVSTAGGTAGVGRLPAGALGSETDGSTLSTPVFSATAGTALNFYFNYVTSDGAGFNDYAWAELFTSSNTPVALLFTARTEPSGNTIPGLGIPAPLATLTPASVPIIGGGPEWTPLGGYSGGCFFTGCGYTGWVKAHYVIPTTGNYYLKVGVVNWIDQLFDSGLAVDGVSIGGIDLSAKPSSSDWAAIIAATTPQFVIARASGGAPASTPVPVGSRAVDILNSIPTGVIVEKAAYAELNYIDSGPAQIEKALASINTQKPSLDFLAIAVEPLSPSDTFAANNIDSRNQIIYDALQTAQNNQLKVAIYTRDQKRDTLDYWRQITGDTSSFGCLPLWDSLPDQVPSLSPAADLPYGGWLIRAGKQYDIGPNNLGVYPPGSNTPVDLDAFHPSYFSAATSWGMARDLTCIDCLRTFAFDAAGNVSVTKQPHVKVTNGDGPPQARPVIIQNFSSTESISGPFSLVIDNLVGGTLVTPTGTTSCTYPRSSPYITLDQDHIDPSQSLTVVLNFSLTGPAGKLKYNTRVLAGAGTR